MTEISKGRNWTTHATPTLQIRVYLFIVYLADSKMTTLSPGYFDHPKHVLIKYTILIEKNLKKGREGRF